MVNFRNIKKIADKAKDQVERRGGTDALKKDPGGPGADEPQDKA